jgi:5-methylcytosine-specific restriction endonuclease McrA
MTLTEKQKELLREFVGQKCEQCGKEDKVLAVHHIKRKSKGGDDSFRNLKVLCSNCHKLYHYKEFR